jgi:endosialidase-like protein
MESRLRILIRLLCVAGLAAPVCAQEVGNWPAPPTWSPSDRHASESSIGPLSIESISAVQAGSPLPFISLTPCRIADTRGNGFTGAYGPPALAVGSPRNFPLFGQCGIPVSAGAVSLNITVTNTQGSGFIKIFPAGVAAPVVSTLNYVAGQTVANAAVVPVGSGGAVTVAAGAAGTDLIIDVNGFYGGPTANGNNVFLGPFAGNSTMTGNSNTGVGLFTLNSLTSGSFNTATGLEALLSDNTGSYNTAFGSLALENNTGGATNAAVGASALAGTQTGTANTGVGFQSLLGNIDGNFNVAIGWDALSTIASGDDNIAIGVQAAVNLTSGSDNIHIGNPGLATESNTIRIGTGGTHNLFFVAGVRDVTTAFANAVPVVIASNGQLGTASSSATLKKDIADVDEEEGDALLRLRPVSFEYCNDTVGIRQYGLIAEEVATVLPELVQYSEAGDPQIVNYHFLPPLLVKELQKQQKTIEQQNDVIAGLEARLARLEARLPAAPAR